MDHRADLRAALALTLVPALVVAPGLGAVAALVLGLLGRPARAAPSRAAVLVLGVVLTIVTLSHTSIRTSSVAVLALVWSGMWTLARLDAVANRAVARLVGVGTSATALALAIIALVRAASSGFSQVSAATHHPNATAALALVLVAGAPLAWGTSALQRVLAIGGVGGGFVVLVLSGSRGGLVGLLATLTMFAVVMLTARIAARFAAARAPDLAVVGVVGAGCLMLLGAQVTFVAPDRMASAWTVVAAGSLDLGPDQDREGRWPLLQRLRQLEQPLGTSGGRLAAWKLAREMIAERPLLGYGFDAIEKVFAPGARRDLAEPLTHPHHGFLTLLLEGGSLLLVATIAFVGGSLRVRLAGRSAATPWPPRSWRSPSASVRWRCSTPSSASRTSADPS